MQHARTPRDTYRMHGPARITTRLTRPSDSTLNYRIRRAQADRCLEKAVLMDELITKYSAIMDQYDPQKRAGLIMDEWGT